MLMISLSLSLSLDLCISLSLSLSLSFSLSLFLSLHDLFYFVLRTLKQLETALQRSEVLDMTLKDEKKNAAILKKEMLGKIEDVRKTSDVLLQRREKELTKENDRKEYATFQKYLNDQLVSVLLISFHRAMKAWHLLQ